MRLKNQWNLERLSGSAIGRLEVNRGGRETALRERERERGDLLRCGGQARD